MSAREWTTEEVEEALGRDHVTVVDALPAAPYAVRHLPGALNLTIEADDASVRQTLPDPEATIVVYSTDATCTRGPDLAERLVGLGYADVGVYRAGIAAWVETGRPVATGDGADAQPPRRTESTGSTELLRAVPILTVADVDAAVRELREVAGLDVLMDLGWVATLGTAGQAQLSVMDTDASAPVNPDVSLEVPDVDAAYARARESGAEIVHPLQDEDWGVRRFFLRTSSGHVVNVLSHQRSEPEEQPAGTALAPVVHFEILGSDPAALREFYAELFGWQYDDGTSVADEVSDAGLYSTVVTGTLPDGTGIPGGVGGGSGREPRTLFYVAVPDVERALATAERLGGTRVVGPSPAPGRPLTVGWFTDPEGHLVGVAGPG